MRVLALNGGSSSIKFAVFEADGAPRRLVSGAIEGVDQATATLRAQAAGGGDATSLDLPRSDYPTAVAALLDWMTERSIGDALAGVGHRVVHGGPKRHRPCIIDADVLRDLREMSPYDPDHLPAEIHLIEAVGERFPNLPQVACFDTAFHHDLPRVAQLLPIPRRYQAAGVRRYGFHGLSYAYLMEELERLAGTSAASGRIVLAHLGSGASMTAVRDGRSIDTTMAFTPASGLVMSTRSGDLDPGLMSFLAGGERGGVSRFDRMVNHESGLLGVSETSGDIRELLARESEDVRAAEAIDLFCYQAKKTVGAYAAALGGLDTLVFSGGIGENAPPIRARICSGLEFLGLELSQPRNLGQAAVISTDDSRVTVRVIHTDEELMLVRSVRDVLDTAEQTRAAPP